MVVKKMNSRIECTDCDYGFNYSTTAIYQKLNTVYNDLFKAHLGKCGHCKEGKLVIVQAKFKVKPIKHRYTLRWRCPKCKEEWTQYEYVKNRDLIKKSLVQYFSEGTKTYCHCNSTDKDLIRMSRG